MLFDPHKRLLHMVSEAHRRVGVADRVGYVKEVKQSGGEQKIRVVMGIKKDGSPWLSPWLHTTDHRGASREQQQFKKGQNVRVSSTDGDFRQATASPAHEGKSFPQPDHAPDIYGDSFQAGKLHKSNIMPDDSEQDQQGGAGKDTGGGGQQSQKNENHRHEVYITKEDNKPPKHEDQSGQATKPGSSSTPQSQQQQKKQSEAAIMVSTDEKDGFTARIGKGDSAVRVSSHEKGAKTRAGETYYSAEKDKDSISRAKKNLYCHAEEELYVNKPWKLKDAPKDAVPNDDKVGSK